MKRWQFWAGAAISAGCIVFVLMQVDDWGKFGRSFLDARWWLLFPIVGSYFLIMFGRAVRWRYILEQCGRVSLRNSFAAILVCYMGNNVFPLRAGEFMRVFLVGRQEESISYSSALATVVVERLFDFITLLVALAVVLMLVPFPVEFAKVENTVHKFGAGTLAGSAVVFVFLLSLYLRTEAMLWLMERLLSVFPARVRDAALGAVRTFASGLVIMGRPRALFATAGMSAAIWLVNLTPIWLSGLAFGIRLDFIGCLFMLVAGSAAASIPATPGFFGTFHAFNQQAMLFLVEGIDPGTALSFAIVLHACYYFPLTAAGAVALWTQGYSLAKLRSQAREMGSVEVEESGCGFS